MRTIIYGDIHGCLEEFKTLRNELKITKEDISNILSKVNFPSSSSGIVDSGSLKNIHPRLSQNMFYLA